MKTPKRFKIPNSFMNCFHSKQSFMKCGFKQLSTWVGIVVFVCVFNKDLVTLINSVLTSDKLSQQIVIGLSGLIMVFFDRINKP